ncbi:hypothetical protein NN561_011638 [Cricetulus griseus]
MSSFSLSIQNKLCRRGRGQRKDLFRRQQTELRGRPGRARRSPAAPAFPTGPAIAAAIFVPKLTLGRASDPHSCEPVSAGDPPSTPARPGLRLWPEPDTHSSRDSELLAQHSGFQVQKQRLNGDDKPQWGVWWRGMDLHVKGLSTQALRSTLEDQKQRNIHLDELLGQQRQLLSDFQQQIESQRMLYNVQLAEEQDRNLELQVLLESEKVKIQEMKDTLDKERELHSNGGQPQPAFPPEEILQELQGPLEEKQKHIMELVNES